MKYLFVCFFILLAAKLSAQTNLYKDSLLNSLDVHHYSVNNLNKNFKRFSPNNNPSHISGLRAYKPFDPNVVYLPKQKLSYIGHSKHLNIYQSSPNKLYIIKPDSMFISNMPVYTN